MFGIVRKNLTDVISALEALKEVPVEDFFDEVESAFSGYDYDGEDELTGHETWPALEEGSFELPIRVDHESAYEMTLHVIVKEEHVSIKSVL